MHMHLHEDGINCAFYDQFSMSQIAEILRAEDRAAAIRGLMDHAAVQQIPALLLLLMVKNKVDEQTREAASELLCKIIKETTFPSVAQVMYPPTPEPESRTIVKAPKREVVTVQMLIFALHAFVSACNNFDITVLNDALKVFIKLTKLQLFQMSTRMLIDAATFALSFIGSDGPQRTRAIELLQKIHSIAEKNNDVDALVALQSIFSIFPEVAPE